MESRAPGQSSKLHFKLSTNWWGRGGGGAAPPLFLLVLPPTPLERLTCQDGSGLIETSGDCEPVRTRRYGRAQAYGIKLLEHARVEALLKGKP